MRHVLLIFGVSMLFGGMASIDQKGVSASVIAICGGMFIASAGATYDIVRAIRWQGNKSDNTESPRQETKQTT
jgi:hypothetical protein